MNPGSLEAIAAGCKCPMEGNNWGTGIVDDVFYITEDCDMHGREKPVARGEDFYHEHVWALMQGGLRYYCHCGKTRLSIEDPSQLDESAIERSEAALVTGVVDP